MTPDGPKPADAVTATIERELSLVRDAISLVAGGGAPRVVVAGLSFGEQLIEPGRHLASAAGLRLVPLWTADDTGADIAVEQPPSG